MAAERGGCCPNAGFRVPVRTRFGVFILEGNARKITGLKFPGRGGKPFIERGTGIPRELKHAAALLRGYFRGRPVSFRNLKLDRSGFTAFEKEVFRRLAEVPPGRVITYGHLASKAGRPGAARAVGGAMRRNPLPVFLPCHRVVAAGGRIGGFSPGLRWKRILLRLERGLACRRGGV